MRLVALQRIYSAICFLLATVLVWDPAADYLSYRTLPVEGVFLVAFGALFFLTALVVLLRTKAAAWFAGLTGALFLVYTISLLPGIQELPLIVIPTAPVTASAGALGIYLATKLDRPADR